MADSPTFQEELRQLINRRSRESGSDTPDFILAEYLENCLMTFDKATNARKHWYDMKEAS